MPAVDALSPIHLHFLVASQQWFPTLWAAATWVFNTLLIAEIVTFIIARGASPALFWNLLIDRVFRILLFKFILINAGWLIPAAINGFIEVGSRAGGVMALQPQSVAAQGLWLIAEMCKHMLGWGLFLHPISVFVGAFCAIGVAISYFVMAFTLSLAMIEMYIVTGAGVFLLGFGGWNGTAGITHRFLSYVVGVGTKLFMTYLLIGAGDVLAKVWGGMVADISLVDATTSFAILFGTMAYGLIVWKIPSLTSSLLTGAVGMGLLESIQTTVEVSRLAVSAAAGGPALIGAGAALAGIGHEVSRLSGGGLRGAMRGFGAAMSAGAREMLFGGAPRVSRGMSNLREQYEDLKARP
jgi:type IV secretion system protein TrbL